MTGLEEEEKEEKTGERGGGSSEKDIFEYIVFSSVALELCEEDR